MSGVLFIKDLFAGLIKGDIIDNRIRVLIVSAHPDDETIGAGSIFNKIENISFLHTTNGAPGNEVFKTAAGLTSSAEYSKQRFNEFYQVLKLAKCAPNHHIKFGFKDQQTSFQLSLLTMRMIESLKSVKPDFIFVHPFEGGHPDHDAAAFAVHNAVSILKMEGHPIEIIEYTSYFNHNGLMQTGEFLSAATPVFKIDLNEKQKVLKQRMYECFASQTEIFKYFPISSEKYRQAPVYDFTTPPSQGKMYYDLFNWGIDSHTWFRNSRIAMNEINYLRKYIHDNT